MKNMIYLLLGVFFGIVMTKSEVISWFRIQEMFRFDSFHMYGIIGMAVVLCAIGTLLIKRFMLRTSGGGAFQWKIVGNQFKRLFFGGTIFGFGWAMTGACPGPLYVLLGHGFAVILVAIAAALAGTLVYGMLQRRLPH